MFSGQKILIKSVEHEPPKRKRVAVIGCGVAGLVSVKTALEHGHDAVGFERLGDIGGLWNYKSFAGKESHAEIQDPDVHCYPAYKTLHTNTTNYNTMFSDFMPLDSLKTDFLSAEEVNKYAQAYACNFQLRDNIRLGAHVKKIDKSGTDKWCVYYQQDGDDKEEMFDNVMVTTGAFAFPKMAEIEGIDRFKGTLIHSGQVRDGGLLFKDKRVLVIGGAYSGGEMMNMALQYGVKKLYVSASRTPDKKSAWSIDRFVKSPYGDKRPWDCLLTRENALVNGTDFGGMLNQWCAAFVKSNPSAQLSYPGDSVAITCMDVVQRGRAQGTLEVVHCVQGFEENDAILRDGTRLSDLDVIICATGYDQKFPFLDHIWARDEQIQCELYNYVLSPNSKLDGIGFMLMQPAGFSLLPAGEMQARWFCHKIIPRSYKDDGSIFSSLERQHMHNVINEKQSQRPPNFRFNYIDNVPLLIDTLANDIGVQPPCYKELIQSEKDKDIELGVSLLYGPYIGTQYRIRGPYAWPQAAEKCIMVARLFLGTHFDEYLRNVKGNIYPRSGLLKESQGPFNVY